jgi:hypothetical protein
VRLPELTHLEEYVGQHRYGDQEADELGEILRQWVLGDRQLAARDRRRFLGLILRILWFRLPNRLFPVGTVRTRAGEGDDSLRVEILVRLELQAAARAVGGRGNTSLVG